MTKIFEVMPKRRKCSDGIGLTPEMVAVGELLNSIEQFMKNNYIYTEFMSNIQLFKPFVSWPNCVHLGLNNVDSISNKLLNYITFRTK